MKKIYLILMVGLMAVTSCSDWLDVEPKTSVPSEKLFESERGYIDALTGVYIKLTSSNLYAHDLTYGYIDELAGVYSSFPNYMSNQTSWKREVYEYEGVFLSKINNVYLQMYNTIANINNFLKHVEADNRKVLKTENYYEIMKGEALALRAFVHFDLLRLYGPVYKIDPTAKAISYRKGFDADATSILPANEVVDLIIADLTEAEKLLMETEPGNLFPTKFSDSETEDDFLSNRQFRMNLYAVKAMLARVYCYKGDTESKSNAVAYAKEVIEAPYFSLYDSQNEYNYSSVRYYEQIFGLSVYELDKSLNTNYMQMTTTLDPQYRYVVEEDLFNSFYEVGTAGNTDWRASRFSFRPNDSFAHYYSMKYNQNMPEQEGTDAVPLIRLPEMYYIVAECASDAATSAEYLNEVRFARAISYDYEIDAGENYDALDTRVDADDNTKTLRINEIMKEYRKEYFAEGQLFFFLKAHNYKTFKGCPVNDMTGNYKWPLPDNETIFGKN